MITTESFNSPEELAAFCTGSTAVYLIVGSLDECDDLTEELSSILLDSEKYVHVSSDAKIFEQMERPTALPALGVWSGKGTLVGYRESDETVAEFVEYARRFT